MQRPCSLYREEETAEKVGCDSKSTEEIKKGVVTVGVWGYPGRMIQRARGQRLSPDSAPGQAPGMCACVTAMVNSGNDEGLVWVDLWL